MRASSPFQLCKSTMSFASDLRYKAFTPTWTRVEELGARGLDTKAIQEALGSGTIRSFKSHREFLQATQSCTFVDKRPTDPATDSTYVYAHPPIYVLTLVNSTCTKFNLRKTLNISNCGILLNPTTPRRSADFRGGLRRFAIVCRRLRRSSCGASSALATFVHLLISINRFFPLAYATRTSCSTFRSAALRYSPSCCYFAGPAST